MFHAQSKRMQPFRNILIATELSEHGDAAVAAGAHLAKLEQAEVHLLHALSLPWLEDPVSLAPVGMTEKDYLNREEERARAELLSAVEKQPLLDSPKLHIQLSSTPAKTICKHAEEQQADLIVVGTHKRTGAARWLMGSVAEMVTRYAPCSVLVVPLEAQLCKSAPRAIVAATDFSTPSWTASDRARSLAVRSGADLTVLRVIERPHVLTSELDTWPATDDVRERARTRMIHKLAGRYGEGHGVALGIEIESDVPGAICGFAAEREIDLVAVGTMGRTGVDRWLLGSVAERVVRLCPKPVLIVRDAA